MNNYELKAERVKSGNSKVFTNWKAHSTISEADFLDALKWVCDDPLNEKGDLTREIGLTPEGIVKLTRVYGKEKLCSFYINDKLWNGAVFEREPTEKEKKFYGNGSIKEIHHISLSCRDNV